MISSVTFCFQKDKCIPISVLNTRGKRNRNHAFSTAGSRRVNLRETPCVHPYTLYWRMDGCTILLSQCSFSLVIFIASRQRRYTAQARLRHNQQRTSTNIETRKPGVINEIDNGKDNDCGRTGVREDIRGVNCVRRNR